MTPVLEIRRLSAGYGPLRVLHDIEIAVAPGERIGLVGLNGHGKTTILRSVMGLVDWRRGEIELNGSSILKTPTYRLVRSGVVLIPQGDALFPGLSVRDNLDSGAFASSWRERKRRRELVCEIFPRLKERMKQPAGTLSGGERRMCSVGRGLMTDAKVYLVDEPSLGLAPGIGTGLVSSLMSLDLAGGALVLAEQNQTLIEGKLDRILRIHGGQVVGVEPGGSPTANHEPAPSAAEEE